MDKCWGGDGGGGGEEGNRLTGQSPLCDIGHASAHKLKIVHLPIETECESE